MPQLSLYIDDRTLKKIELAAKIEKLSLSKYVVKKLNESLVNSWPENYEVLFGSIRDDSFKEAGSQTFEDDQPREGL